ncbi:MAG: Gfo/Idh/MocA family oxidoreductase [Bacteroidales bacterium]|nr:Gfo/Idh/MocA family oxidoreductase [Bacteroidales bacterium]MBN2761490.1 Gfo/Idh/MocA family oxidoreductase [Bacteroidales bacterium]
MNVSRRKFIKNSAVAMAGIGATSSFPLPMKAAAKKISANEKIIVGLIGCKGMGFSNIKAFLQQPEVECAALCDIDQNVLDERLYNLKESYGKKPAVCNDYRKLLENKDIDAVIIATPDHWHCLQTVHALEAGKDVYVEKPLANTVKECNIIENAARRYKRVIQVGQWQRSDPHWQEAVGFVHSGKLGRVRMVKVWSFVGWKGALPVLPDEPVPAGVDYNMWLGPAPGRPFNRNRFHFTFRWFWDYAGGLMTDWGVHLLDYALLGMNVYSPKSVISSGGKYAFPDDPMETPDTQQAIYEFDDFGLIWEHTIGIYGGNYGRGHGVAYIGEFGTLVVDRNGWEVIPEVKSKTALMEAVPLRKIEGNGLLLHIRNFLDCMQTRNNPNASVEIGAHIARIAHLGNIAYRTGRKIYWDADTLDIVNDEDAGRLLVPEYREPWQLPGY